MQELSRYLFVLLIALLFILSFSVVQCRSVLPQTIDHEKKSLRNLDYINMCMFRKTRLCDYLREMDNTRVDQTKEDREVWKRRTSRFYSNW